MTSHHQAAVFAGGCGRAAVVIRQRFVSRGDGIAFLGVPASTRSPDRVSDMVLDPNPFSRTEIENAALQAEQRLGPIRSLIYEVTESSQTHSLSSMHYSEWSMAIEQPLARILALSQGMFPALARGKGAILFLVPGGGTAPGRGIRACLWSAVYSFVRGLSREYGPVNVRVNGIAADDGASQRELESTAALADFLLSERAGYISGQLLGCGTR